MTSHSDAVSQPVTVLLRCHEDAGQGRAKEPLYANAKLWPCLAFSGKPIFVIKASSFKGQAAVDMQGWSKRPRADASTRGRALD